MKILSRLRALFQKDAIESEMSEEMRLHLEHRTREYEAAGLSPEEARYAALRQFGGVEQVKEQCRDQRVWTWVEQTMQDLRYAGRQWRRNPAFTVVAVLSLGVGIGGTTAVFSVVNEVLLKPLPFRDARELVRFKWAGSIDKIDGSYSDIYRDRTAGFTGTTFTLLAFQVFEKHNETLETLFAYRTLSGHTAVIDNQAEVAGDADYVSADYFRGLRIDAVLGRTLEPADNQPGAPPVGMISYEYWTRRFGQDPTAVGRTIVVNATPLTIVGVTPRRFHGAKSFGIPSPLFLPLSLMNEVTGENLTTNPGARWKFGILGRLKTDRTVAQAQANFAAAFRQSIHDGSGPAANRIEVKDMAGDFPHLMLEQNDNGSDSERNRDGGKMGVLSGLVVLVLFIACANVANLLLARSAARRKEIAVRLALGSGRSRLIRQLLTESLLLALGGGLIGLILGAWGADVLMQMFRFGGVERIGLDWRVFAFATAVSCATGLIFGLAPALRATRLTLSEEFQGGSRTVGRSGGARLRLDRSLMVAQVALSFVVLVGAGLFLLTLHNLRAADVGFERDHLLLFRVDATGYQRERKWALFTRINDEVRKLPGVRTSTYSSIPVLAGHGNAYAVRIPGREVLSGGRPVAASLNDVGPEFFETFGLPLILGRTFDRNDERSDRAVAVINRVMAQTFFPGENPIGRHFTAGHGEQEIIGVVGDMKYETVRAAAPPTAYSPYEASQFSGANFALRTTIDPAALADSVRKSVQTIDPMLAVSEMRTQNEQTEELLATERMFARLASLLGGVALGLVCIGLHGLISYAVLRRRNEIGVRMALGAQPNRVVRMILGESGWLLATGMLAGVAGALGATRLIATMLFEISATDATTYAAAAALLGLVGLVACWLPARRAAKVDPMVALRCE